MISNRKSSIIRVLKILQPLLNLISVKTSAIKKTSEPNIIFIVGIPRSGTTLSYQIFSNYFQCSYLRNIDNLFYKNFYWTLNKLKKHEVTDYKSNLGFTSGVYGHAEGRSIFKYWLNNDLTESEKFDFNLNKIIEFKGTISSVSSKHNPFIFSYIGNLFIVNKLLALFPNSVVIRLRRNTKDLSRSLEKLHEKNSFFSLKPIGYKNQLSKSNRVKAQFQIKRCEKILFQSKHGRIFDLDYEEICLNTEESLLRFKKFYDNIFNSDLLKRKGIVLPRFIPKKYD